MNLSSKLSQPIFKVISEAADKLDVECYVIGGFVRDLKMGRDFNQDIDIVCIGSGIELAEAVSGGLEGHPKVTVFKNFGTAHLKTEGLEVEFVGARKESYREDSRKPLVEDGTLEDDQRRRDFTINAMAISLNGATYGDFIDPFDGMKDLKRKMIRTPLEPEVTFSDDPLRMMRAIRFAAQLNFDIGPATFDAIIAQKERISIVSMERIAEELNKVIMTDKPSYGFKLLYHAGLLELIFPDMTNLQGVEVKEGKTHKDNFYHTLQVLDNIAEHTDDLWLRWAAILHDIAKPATKRFHHKAGWTFHGHEDKGARMVPKIFRELKLPLNEKMKYVQKLVRLHLRPIALVKETVTDSAIRRLLVEAGDDIDDLMMLCKADITSKDNKRVVRYLANFEKVEQKLAEVEESDHLRNFQPVISGNDIMKTFGLKPDRSVGEIKAAIREAILEGEIRNERDEAYAFMLREGEKRGLRPI